MLKSVIIDDEDDARSVMIGLLKRFNQDISLVAVCKNGKEGVQAIIHHQPDLVFLDIDMPGMDGFDVLDCVKHLPLKIIFVTAHNQHAIRAFKYSAIDYLMKPVGAEDLESAVEKVKNRQVSQMQSEQYQMVLKQFRQKDNLPEVIALPMADGLHVVNISEIMYCKAERNYSYVHQQNKEQILVSRPLKEFETILQPHGFFRIHHSSLINLRFISRYVRSDGGYVLMKDGKSIEISRQRKDEFLKLLQKL